MSDAYRLLNQPEEDAVHPHRLLNVEERPFKRVTKRLLAPDSPVNSVKEEEWDQFYDSVILDFAAFDNGIARMQFLLESNEKERRRYAEEKIRIEEATQSVRQNTVELRVRLEEAQNQLTLRKTYDELTEKITSNRLLRPREDQWANLEKLQAEIARLEAESKEYAQTWAERREQFGRIVEEGTNLRRLIRDEKEEVERREGMVGVGDSEGLSQPTSLPAMAAPIEESTGQEMASAADQDATLMEASKG